MKLTIIPSDKIVCEDGKCYMPLNWSETPANVHALQYDTVLSSGWIEYNDGQVNEPIASLPQWALNAELAWDEANKPPAPPGPPTAEQNKQSAMSLLQATDWVNQPDVRNTANVPHLLNGQEFDAYRVAVRIYAVYPVAGDIDWPVKPVEQWSDPFEGIS
jgi:hypothetical protein